MRKVLFLGLAAAALLWAGPAFAFQIPQANAPYPTPHQREVADSQSQRWSTTYGDEAARRLGMQDGRWEAFGTDSNPSSRFNLRGGLDGRGAVLRLTW